jgi:hypothetical protein
VEGPVQLEGGGDVVRAAARCATMGCIWLGEVW